MALLQPDPKLMKEILKDINETHEGVLEVNKKLIKEWLDCQPHLPHNYGKLCVCMYVFGEEQFCSNSGGHDRDYCILLYYLFDEGITLNLDILI